MHLPTHLAYSCMMWHMHTVWFTKPRQTVQVVHGGEVVAGMICLEVCELNHEASEGFEQVLAHGVAAGRAAGTIRGYSNTISFF